MDIVASGISHSFEKKPVLKNVAIKIHPGDWISFYGPSGSGKTTLLKILGCLIKPSHGDLKIDGKDAYDMGRNDLRSLRKIRFWYAFTDGHFVEDVTARENIMLSCVLGKTPIRPERLERLSDTLQMTRFLDQKMQNLSTGQRDRIGIIAGLVHDPDCIVIDEPGAGLDETLKKILFTVLENERKKWRIILCASHDPELLKYSTASYSIHDFTIHSLPSRP